MPGPGGGSHGGGGHGGGFGGGGFGGGHGGGYGRGPRGYGYGGYRGGWFWRPRFYYGGGCLGGLVGMLIAPFILLLLVVIIFAATFSTGFGALKNGGYVYYDEDTFQEYADAQYRAEFGSESAYEDKLLIVVLIDEDYREYDYIAWVGDDINSRIANMFGNDYTAFGNTIEANINLSGYRFSLDSNLAGTIRSMADQIENLGLSSSFTCSETHVENPSHLTNRTELDLNESTVNNALASFTDQTGIETVIVVENQVDVFGKTMPIFPILFMIVFTALAVFLIVRAVKAYKNKEENE